MPFFEIVGACFYSSLKVAEAQHFSAIKVAQINLVALIGRS
jgi:hypothetical protein